MVNLGRTSIEIKVGNNHLGGKTALLLSLKNYPIQRLADGNGSPVLSKKRDPCLDESKITTGWKGGGGKRKANSLSSPPPLRPRRNR